MKISRLMVRGYQQFEDLDLDLTSPTTGQPLDRVCFVGSNGTGKSTLLRLLSEVTRRTGLPSGAVALLELSGDEGRFVMLIRSGTMWLTREPLGPDLGAFLQFASNENYPGRDRTRSPLVEDRDFAVMVNADASTLLSNDPPATTLSDALNGHQHVLDRHEVGPHTADAFWGYVISSLAKRRDRYLAFLDRPENSTRIQGELKAAFDRDNPELLPALAELWRRLLEPAGLELDLENARLPSQLTESLSMHVRLARTKEPLPYNALSSGLRSFLFRLGYLKTLFFERPTGSSFVLVDEPEASLHPDFLYDIVDVYQSVCVGSQLFFATHSPIVAAQFKPEERVILEFDENRFVTASRGSAPEGDDPNDLLQRDFHVRSVLGKEGVKKWKRFLELDELLRRETDASRRAEYRREYMEIGAAYNFEPHPDA